MKSKKTQEFINNNEMDAANLVDKNGCGWAVVSIYDAYEAVELAEQDAEERMRDKAIEAFCEDCPLYNHAVNCPDCSALNAFKQRLNEE